VPTYEYRCDECGVVFERFQHFAEDPLKICPECHGTVRRVIHPVGVIFQGSGWYVTDHRGDTSALMPKAKAKEQDNGVEKQPAKDASKAPSAEPAASGTGATKNKA
jgi:putative FmdB family regulatory protein